MSQYKYDCLICNFFPLFSTTVIITFSHRHTIRHPYFCNHSLYHNYSHHYYFQYHDFPRRHFLTHHQDVFHHWIRCRQSGQPDINNHLLLLRHIPSWADGSEALLPAGHNDHRRIRRGRRVRAPAGASICQWASSRHPRRRSLHPKEGLQSLQASVSVWRCGPACPAMASTIKTKTLYVSYPLVISCFLFMWKLIGSSVVELGNLSWLSSHATVNCADTGTAVAKLSTSSNQRPNFHGQHFCNHLVLSKGV